MPVGEQAAKESERQKRSAATARLTLSQPQTLQGEAGRWADKIAERHMRSLKCSQSEGEAKRSEDDSFDEKNSFWTEQQPINKNEQ